MMLPLDYVRSPGLVRLSHRPPMHSQWQPQGLRHSSFLRMYHYKKTFRRGGSSFLNPSLRKKKIEKKDQRPLKGLQEKKQIETKPSRREHVLEHGRSVFEIVQERRYLLDFCNKRVLLPQDVEIFPDATLGEYGQCEHGYVFQTGQGTTRRELETGGSVFILVQNRKYGDNVHPLITKRFGECQIVSIKAIVSRPRISITPLLTQH